MARAPHWPRTRVVPPAHHHVIDAGSTASATRAQTFSILSAARYSAAVPGNRVSSTVVQRATALRLGAAEIRRSRVQGSQVVPFRTDSYVIVPFCSAAALSMLGIFTRLWCPRRLRGTRCDSRGEISIHVDVVVHTGAGAIDANSFVTIRHTSIAARLAAECVTARPARHCGFSSGRPGHLAHHHHHLFRRDFDRRRRRGLPVVWLRSP